MQIETIFDTIEANIKKRDFAQAETNLAKTEKLILENFDTTHSTYAEFLFCKGNLYLYTKQLKDAEKYMLQAHKQRERIHGKISEEYGMAQNKLAAIYWYMGKYEKSETLYKELLSIYEKLLGKEHRKYIRVLNNLGSLYGATGRYKDAKPYLVEAKSIFEKLYGKEHADYANSAEDLGRLYVALGDYKAAEELYLEVKAIRLKILGADHEDHAGILLGLGSLNLEIGRYETAAENFSEGLKVSEEIYGEGHRYTAGILVNLGRAYALQEDYESAEPLFIQANKIREKSLGKQHPRYAIGINHLAILYFQTGRYEEAERLFMESLAIREKVYGKENSRYFYVLNDLGRLYQRTDRMDMAEKAFKDAEAICMNNYGEYHHESILCFNNLSKLYFEKGEKEKAALYFEKCNRVTKELREIRATHLTQDEMLAYSAKYEPADGLFLSFSHIHQNPTFLEEAYDNNLLYKGFLLDYSLQIENAVSSAPEEIKNKYGEWKKQSQELARQYSLPLGKREGSANLEASVQALEKEVLSSIPNIDETSRHINWKGIQQKLNGDEIIVDLVSYKFSDPMPTDDIFYSALIFGHQSPHPELVPLLTKKEIGNIKATRKLYASGGILEEKIWGSLSPYLQNKKRIYFSPDGIFHRINFGAIPIGGDETIADRFEIWQMGNTRILAYPEKINSDNMDALVFGGIDYDDGTVDLANNNPENSDLVASRNHAGLEDSFRNFRGDNWDNLEWTAQEAAEVSHIFEKSGINVELKTGNNATEDYFKKIGTPNDGNASPHIVHLATHGYFFPKPDENAGTGFQSAEHPLIRSGLIMAGANHVWKGGEPAPGKDDGILTAYEIAQLDLSNTELVVLSACETGLGDIEGSEGVYGLQRAFKLAGAKYVLMSLWSVKDKKAYEFMTQFYSQWQEGKKEIPDAYQAAQSYMREKYTQPFNPNAWAGFVLMQ